MDSILTAKLKFDLLTKKNYQNIHELPEVNKVVLNMGLKEVAIDKYALIPAIFTFQLICGKKPIITKSKQSVSAFKVRKGTFLGLKVVLRKKEIASFFKKLTLMILPSDKNFVEFNRKHFDKTGNFSFGIKELHPFPEINFQLDKNNLRKLYGLSININIKNSNNLNSKILLSLLGIPFFN